ncbi:MAG: hypothetical protein NT150_14020 [Bacteroidetes bacterium]|nr:hypothetical protein [Bacteroidota bacterium]
MKKIAFLLLTILLTTEFVAAQDKVELLSGKVKKGIVDHETAEYIYFKKKEGGLVTRISKERIFRVLKSSGDTMYVYRQDTLLEDDYSIAQIEKHIQGQNEARKYYKPWKAAVGGFCVGGASGVLPLFYAFMPPGVYMALIGTWTINEDNFIASDETLLSDEYFVNGYELAARGKKMRYALVGSVTGLATGMMIMYIVYPYRGPSTW